jgi:hypothetical protein
MNARKLLALLLAALMITAAFAGCAAKSQSGDYYENKVEVAPGDGIYDSSDTIVSPTTDRKLIRRISMDTQTREMDTLLSSITAKVTELGGYIESRNVSSGNSYNGGSQNRYANLTIRIPAQRLDEFVLHVDDTSNVTSTRESSEDITLNYVATESRMKALQAEEARLLQLIDKAANLTELLQLEKRLTEVRTELERVTSQLKLYDNLVDYGTVELSIREVREYTPTEEPGFWERISNGFVNSLKNLGVILTELVIFFVCAVPYLLPLLAIGSIILLAMKLASKKKKKPTDKES